MKSIPLQTAHPGRQSDHLDGDARRTAGRAAWSARWPRKWRLPLVPVVGDRGAGDRRRRPAAQTLVEPGKVAAALQHVKAVGVSGTVYLFKDLGPHCKDPQVVRSLRDLYFSPDSRLWTLMLVDAGGLPPEVRRLTVPFDVGWPDEEELTELVRKTFQDVQRRSLRPGRIASSPSASWNCWCRRCAG